MMTNISAKEFWQTLGTRPVGATVVTSTGLKGPSGFLALSFAHVSANPPTVLVSVDNKTSALVEIIESGIFAVNILPAGDEQLAMAFGGRVSAHERFHYRDWETLVTGAPVLAASAGVFDCQVKSVLKEENVNIVIGTVVSLRVGPGSGSTVVASGTYRDFRT
jgi:flavin reductase (DIM6/NTAB) family NADH-FMN oxidoreductase RutF